MPRAKRPKTGASAEPSAAESSAAESSAVEPDELVRQEAGSYRTADGRFEVRNADAGWYLVDTERTDELGQERLIGPFPTLKAVRQAIPDARRP